MRQPPAAREIALADLGSRLRALPVVGIEPPDDILVAALLVKQFADRQIRVAPGVIAYLLPRMERSFAAAAQLAEAARPCLALAPRRADHGSRWPARSSPRRINPCRRAT